MNDNNILDAPCFRKRQANWIWLRSETRTGDANVADAHSGNASRSALDDVSTLLFFEFGQRSRERKCNTDSSAFLTLHVHRFVFFND